VSKKPALTAINILVQIGLFVQLEAGLAYYPNRDTSPLTEQTSKDFPSNQKTDRKIGVARHQH